MCYLGRRGVAPITMGSAEVALICAIRYEYTVELSSSGCR